MQNELALHRRAQIESYFTSVWNVMRTAMERGMNTEGVLPGGLKIMRRAAPLRRLLQASNPFSSDPMKIVDWVNMFALAVSEENAAGGRVVTAPTNGACGIIPAVLSYYDQFVMRRTSPPRVTLDEVIESMYQTGKDMNAKYRETSKGGLARTVHCK
jgi:L-serine dehydratase